MSSGKHESREPGHAPIRPDQGRLQALDGAFRWFEGAARGTFDTPHIGWRTAYAAICLVGMQIVAMVIGKAITRSYEGFWIGLPIAIALSGMVVFWARRGDADARLRKNVLPALARTLQELRATDAEIEGSWSRTLARNPKLGRRITLEEILRRTQAG